MVLYPSIDQDESPKIVADEIRKSDLDYDNMDMHLMGVYLGIMMNKSDLKKEGLDKLIPNRNAVSNKGRKPTIHTKELGGPRRRVLKRDKDDQDDDQYDDRPHVGKCLDKDIDGDDEEEEESKWRPFYRKYSNEENKKMVAKVVEIALRECFKNHIYQADNILYKQMNGEGIGSRVTGVVERILMDVWADSLSENLVKNKVIIYLLAKYVDDVNLAVSPISRGHSWKKKEDGSWKLIWSEEQ